MRVSGKVYAESGKNTDKTDGCQSRGITTGNLTVLNGGEVTAKVNGQKNGSADSREAIHVSGTLSVAENGYIRGETNNSGYSGIHAGKLYIRAEANGFAAITQPVWGEHYNGDFYPHPYQFGVKGQTVEITGLNRCTLYLRRAKAASQDYWYKNHSFSKDNVNETYYDNSTDGTKSYDLANGQYAFSGGTDPKDCNHLGHIEIQDTANLLLDNVVRTDLSDTFITVKSGQTLNLKLKINTDTQTGPSLLHGSSTNPPHRGGKRRYAASNTAGTTYSEPLTLYTVPAVTVTERPSKNTFAPGEQVRFAFTVEDLSGVAVRCQWQVNRPGENIWEDISGADATAYALPVGEDMDGWRYRCEVTFTYPGGAVETAYASGGRLLVVRTPVIAVQPQSVTVTAGADAAFSVTASGSYYDLLCQWHVSADGGQTWTDVPGGSGSAATSKTASLSLPAVTAEMNGWQYRCVLTHAFDGVERSVTSDAAVLTVVGIPEITAQPKDLGGCRYSFTMPAGAVTVAASFMGDNSVLNFFVDVPNDAYYFEPVKWAVGRGITGGTDSLHFSPDRPCTREQAVAILHRFAKAQGLDTTQGGMAVREFDDIDRVSPYTGEAMAWAVNAGIL